MPPGGYSREDSKRSLFGLSRTDSKRSQYYSRESSKRLLDLVGGGSSSVASIAPRPNEGRQAFTRDGSKRALELTRNRSRRLVTMELDRRDSMRSLNLESTFRADIQRGLYDNNHLEGSFTFSDSKRNVMLESSFNSGGDSKRFLEINLASSKRLLAVAEADSKRFLESCRSDSVRHVRSANRTAESRRRLPRPDSKRMLDFGESWSSFVSEISYTPTIDRIQQEMLQGGISEHDDSETEYGYEEEVDRPVRTQNQPEVIPEGEVPRIEIFPGHFESLMVRYTRCCRDLGGH